MSSMIDLDEKSKERCCSTILPYSFLVVEDSFVDAHDERILRGDRWIV